MDWPQESCFSPVYILYLEKKINTAEQCAERQFCLLYTSDAADERSSVDLGGRRIIKKKNNIETDMSRYYQKIINNIENNTNTSDKTYRPHTHNKDRLNNKLDIKYCQYE